jgi:putative phage-type endonuclease
MNPSHLEKIKFLLSIEQAPQKSEEWLNKRKTALTSSDSATGIGINPYEKPIKLLFKKNNAGEPFTSNVATLHGERFETEAIKIYNRLMGKTNFEFGLISWNDLKSIRKDQKLDKFLEENPGISFDFLAGSPDSVAIDNMGSEEPVLLEVKCPYKRQIKYGEIPEYYLSQVQLNMFILDLKIADFIEYTPANVEPKFLQVPEFNIIRIHRDYDWFFKNVVVLYNFWQDVLYWRKVGIENHPEYEKHAYNPNKIKKPRIKKSEKNEEKSEVLEFRD